MSEIIGLGHDVVDTTAFADQLDVPGSNAFALFSQREVRQAKMRVELKHDSLAVHLAARWAGKEAVLKAWSQGLGSRPAPYTIDSFPWVDIEILDDSFGRPTVTLPPPVMQSLFGSLGLDEYAEISWKISLTHDGSVASAVVLLLRD